MPRRMDESLMPPSYLIDPIKDKVVVYKDAAPEQHGVIIIPETVRDREIILTGRVAAVGPDVTSLSPGDYVCFGQYAGTQVKIDDETYHVMLEKDIHVVLRERKKE